MDQSLRSSTSRYLFNVHHILKPPHQWNRNATLFSIYRISNPPNMLHTSQSDHELQLRPKIIEERLHKHLLFLM